MGTVEERAVGMVRVAVNGATWLRQVERLGYLLGIWTAWQIGQRWGMAASSGVLLILGWLACPKRLKAHRVDLSLDGRVTVITDRGRRITGRIAPRQFVTPWLVILDWYAESGGRQVPLVMTARGIEANEWRRFRVLLRQPL